MAEEYTTRDNPIAIGLNTMIDEGMLDDDALVEHDETNAFDYESLASYIVREFDRNARARENSGIEDEIMDSLRAYNGNYSSKDIARIKASGGSEIFMNLTATKARAAKSWITDVFRPTKGDPWKLEPSPLEELPKDIQDMVMKALEKEFSELTQTPEGPQGAAPEGGGQPAPAGQPKAPGMEKVQETLREQNQKKRDIQRAIAGEITTEAKYQLEKMQRKIRDQLKEGQWDVAFADFLDDFVVYPAAFIKGPIIINGKKLVWAEGKPKEIDTYIMLNKRVNPIDMYPSQGATCIDEGNLIEHLRLDKVKVQALRGVENYIDEALDKVIDDANMGIMGSWVDTSIEQEKADQEKRGDYFMEDGVIHGMHFWGFITVGDLKQWQFYEKLEAISEMNDNAVVNVEAVLIGNHVVKCVLNDDPLGRRPYYKASFMNIPGSFWGKSLPMSMDAQQRMCNAVSRALSNNLGVASGPQIELYIDRLADKSAIEEVTPFKIWQLKSDPTGAGGRAINFWQPQSNAGDLLNVYKRFEEMADDVTGIPKYAYGNEKSSGATQTAQGLAMLLETTSKIIKDCIRNIDEGVLKRRIMYQFHHNMLNLDELQFSYTGDINVVTIGSEALAIRGAEATRRNEFLQATANPTDLAVMGTEGRAAILRKMAEDLNLPSEIVPTDYEIKAKMKKQEAQQAQQAQAMAEAEKAKAQAGIQATTVQIEGQKEMHVATMQANMAKMQADMKKHNDEMQVKMADLQRKLQETQAKLQVQMMSEEAKKERQTQEVAVKLKQGSGI